MDNSWLYYCGLDGRLPRHIWVMGLGRKYRDMINLMILTKLLKIFELRLDVRRGMGGTWSESRILGTSEDRHYYILPASRASNEDFHNHIRRRMTPRLQDFKKPKPKLAAATDEVRQQRTLHDT